MKNQRSRQKQLRAILPEQFTRRWAGFATTKLPYKMVHSDAELIQFAQRTGERSDDYRFGAFLSTTDRDEVEALTLDYPKRWHVEEFFNAHQALGWGRAGTMNLHIRYGQMTMALIAQAVLHRLRRRLGEPYDECVLPTGLGDRGRFGGFSVRRAGVRAWDLRERGRYGACLGSSRASSSRGERRGLRRGVAVRSGSRRDRRG